MANNFDTPPLYDAVTKEDKDYLSSIWLSWFATFFETLTGYLTQNGVLLPILTTAQRDLIRSPMEGQIIYNIDAIPGPPLRTAQIQVWQVKSDVGAWHIVTTT
jgi:hypothetical protein